MRTLTVDTRGLFFSLRMLVVVGLLVGVWYAWVPLQQHTVSEGQAAHASEGTHDAAAVQAAIDRLMKKDTIDSRYVAAAVASNIPYAGRAVVVNVDTMEVQLYVDHEVQLTLPIVHVPDLAAPTTLRQGTYTVDLKEEAQLSTVKLVRFPYYVKFGDRYAFHGTPAGANEEPLDVGYAGGSVELAMDDAARLYEFVEVGSEVIVYMHRGDDAAAANTATESIDVAAGDLPATSALAYVVADVTTGQTFIVKNASERYPIASITKLMTAAVASDVIGHGSEVWAPNNQLYTLGDLYYPLLLRSDNRVANAIAANLGTNEFLANMNAYAEAHEMHMTSFADPSGLSPKNISSANDLTVLARHLYNDKPYILDISSEESMTITSVAGVRWNMTNQNKLAADPYFRGGKLGYTDEAGQTALSLFNLPLEGDTHVVSVAVLGSKDWKQDTRTLLRWLVQHASEQG